eukprot:TRINITY_DN5272_c0_g1_i9.p1 TRINITY_DN5272_c0_g1~~TRINITY_DN5272_c0_g1_i9.p1  ORF type:complete len:213 (-),score=-14.16 TRINITY_DN5272_c0_g1_i9:149-787(-)
MFRMLIGHQFILYKCTKLQFLASVACMQIKTCLGCLQTPIHSLQGYQVVVFGECSTYANSNMFRMLIGHQFILYKCTQLSCSFWRMQHVCKLKHVQDAYQYHYKFFRLCCVLLGCLSLPLQIFSFMLCTFRWLESSINLDQLVIFLSEFIRFHPQFILFFFCIAQRSKNVDMLRVWQFTDYKNMLSRPFIQGATTFMCQYVPILQECTYVVL